MLFSIVLHFVILSRLQEFGFTLDLLQDHLFWKKRNTPRERSNITLAVVAKRPLPMLTKGPGKLMGGFAGFD